MSSLAFYLAVCALAGIWTITVFVRVYRYVDALLTSIDDDLSSLKDFIL